MKISIGITSFSGEFAKFQEIGVPEGADEVRLVLENGYDGPEIVVHSFCANGEPLDRPGIPGQKGSP